MKKSSSFVKVLSVAMILAAANSFFGCKNNSDSDEETDTTTSTTKPVEEQKPGENLIEDDFTASGWESNIYDQKNEVGVRVKADFKATKTSFTADVTKCDHELDDYSCGIQLKRVVTVGDEKTYKLTFDIEVDKDAKAKWAIMGHKGDDYPWYGGGDLFDLKAGEKKTVTGTVKLSSKAAENAFKPDYETLLAFDFLSAAKFTVTNVKFELVDTTQSPPPSIPEGTIPEGATKIDLSTINWDAGAYTITKGEAVKVEHIGRVDDYVSFTFTDAYNFGENNTVGFTITNNGAQAAYVKINIQDTSSAQPDKSTLITKYTLNGGAAKNAGLSDEYPGFENGNAGIPAGGKLVVVMTIVPNKSGKLNIGYDGNPYFGSGNKEETNKAENGNITISHMYMMNVDASSTPTGPVVVKELNLTSKEAMGECWYCSVNGTGEGKAGDFNETEGALELVGGKTFEYVNTPCDLSAVTKVEISIKLDDTFEVGSEQWNKRLIVQVVSSEDKADLAQNEVIFLDGDVTGYEAKVTEWKEDYTTVTVGALEQNTNDSSVKSAANLESIRKIKINTTKTSGKIYIKSIKFIAE